MLLLHRSLSAIFQKSSWISKPEIFHSMNLTSENGKQAHWKCFDHCWFPEAQSFLLAFLKACPIFCLKKGRRRKKKVFSSYCLKYINAHISDTGLLCSLDIGLNGAFLYSGSADLGNRTYQAQYSLWIKREMSSGRAGMGETEDSSELCNGVAEVRYSWCSWYSTE